MNCQFFLREKIGDNLHEISVLLSGENKKNVIHLSSADFAHRVFNNNNDNNNNNYYYYYYK